MNEQGTWVIRNRKTKEIIEEFRVQGTCFVAFRKIPLYERNQFEMVKAKHPQDKFKKIMASSQKKKNKKEK